MFQNNVPFTVDDTVEFVVKSKVYNYPNMSIYAIADTKAISIDQSDRLLSRLELQLSIKRALRSTEGAILLELSKITSKIGPPTDKYTL